MTEFIGVICGLKAEAETVAKSAKSAGIDKARLKVAVSGADAARAEVLVEGLLAAGARAIVSAGLAGGVDPARATGALIVGERVVTPSGEVYMSDERLLLAADAADSHAVILGSDEILKSVAEKENAFRRYAACCVDMESHGAARAAARANAPFITVRAIADSASRALPSAAFNAIAPDGRVRAMAVFMNCMKKPEEFEQIFALARDSDAAHETLRRDFGRLLGAFFRVLDL